MAIIFNSISLSAGKTGLIGTELTTLSSTTKGMYVISLSTNDLGIAYNAVTTLAGGLTQISVQGSVFKIDQAYNGSVMALVKNNNTYTTFTYASAYAVQPLSAFTIGNVDVSTLNTQRLHLLGYR